MSYYFVTCHTTRQIGIYNSNLNFEVFYPAVPSGTAKTQKAKNKEVTPLQKWQNIYQAKACLVPQHKVLQCVKKRMKVFRRQKKPLKSWLGIHLKILKTYCRRMGKFYFYRECSVAGSKESCCMVLSSKPGSSEESRITGRQVENGSFEVE